MDAPTNRLVFHHHCDPGRSGQDVLHGSTFCAEVAFGGKCFDGSAEGVFLSLFSLVEGLRRQMVSACAQGLDRQTVPQAGADDVLSKFDRLLLERGGLKTAYINMNWLEIIGLASTHQTMATDFYQCLTTNGDKFNTAMYGPWGRPCCTDRYGWPRGSTVGTRSRHRRVRQVSVSP